MKKMLISMAGMWLFLAGVAFAEPDPRDSVILESKVVLSNLNGSPAFTMKVYITNKDSLTFLTLVLREATVSGTAYALLNTPRNFNGTITPLTAGLQYFAAANFAHYNNSSPDTVLWSAGFDPTNRDFTLEPPHLARTAVWEMKFEHTSDSSGLIEFDSTRLVGQSIYFTNQVPVDVRVNFVKSDIGVSNGPYIQLVEPPNNGGVCQLNPTLIWRFVKLSSDTLTAKYRAVIADNAAFSPADTSPVLAETTYTVPSPLLAYTTYYWKVFATLSNGDTVQPLETWRFITLLNNLSNPFVLLYPPNDGGVCQLTPTFSWRPILLCSDSLLVNYRVVIANDSSFSPADTSPVLSETTYTISSPLVMGATYYWKVLAILENGDILQSLDTRKFYVFPDRPPQPFQLFSPLNGGRFVRKALSFDWLDAIDSNFCGGFDTVSYTLYISPDSSFLTGYAQSGINGSAFTIPGGALTRGARYFWKVKASDSRDSSTFSTDIRYFDFLKLGDANADLELAPSDVVLLINWVFIGLTPIIPREVVDMNCDGGVNTSDIVLALNAVFLNQPPPCDP